MTRTVSFDNQKRFEIIYNGLLQGHNFVVAQARARQDVYPFDKVRKHAKIVKKFKRVSDQPDVGISRRVLKEPLPQVIKLDEDELQLLKELYEKVDWNSALTDEVVDALDFLMGSPQGEDD
jgi:hypothetical protein